MSKTIAIGSDHAGYQLKERLKVHLIGNKFGIKDFGVFSETSTDYPDIAHPISEAIENKEFDIGILICGSGNGVAITANKHQGIRAALCWTPDISALARQHNDANILCIPARFLSEDEAIQILDSFIGSNFEGGRHISRVQKIKLPATK